MDLFEQLRPLIVDAAIILITALATMLGARLQAWTGMQIEARHREALQSALANAAQVCVDKGMERAIAYVSRSVPDALAHFRVDGPDRIADLILPHVNRLRN